MVQEITKAGEVVAITQPLLPISQSNGKAAICKNDLSCDVSTPIMGQQNADGVSICVTSLKREREKERIHTWWYGCIVLWFACIIHTDLFALILSYSENQQLQKELLSQDVLVDLRELLGENIAAKIGTYMKDKSATTQSIYLWL